MTLKESYQFDKVLFEYRWQEIKQHAYMWPILDIGCGNGEMIRRKLTKGFDTALGIDPKCAEAKKQHPDNFVVAKFEDVGKPKLQFKTVIMSHVLEHVEDDFKVLNKCYEWMHDLGTLIVTVPNALAFHKRLGNAMELTGPFELTPANRAKGHRRNYSVKTLTAALEACGFMREEWRGIFFKPLPSDLMIRYFDQLMFDGFYEMGKLPDLQPYCSSIMVVARKK